MAEEEFFGGAILSLEPVDSPPPGHRANLTGPSDLTTTFQAVIYTMIALMSIFLSLRLFLQTNRNEKWKSDDCEFCRRHGL